MTFSIDVWILKQINSEEERITIEKKFKKIGFYGIVMIQFMYKFETRIHSDSKVNTKIITSRSFPIFGSWEADKQNTDVLS